MKLPSIEVFNVALPPILSDILLGVGVGLLAVLVLKKIIPRFTRKSKSDFDDFVASALGDIALPITVLITLYLIEDNLGIQGDALAAYDIVLRLVGLFILVRFLNRVGTRFFQGVGRRTGNSDLNVLIQSLMPLFQAAVWAIGALVFLQSIGVKMAVIWGLLSAGGIGIGLALKEPAQELFAYLMILLDKPFTVGQFISVGSVSATVEKIGVRSTHLRSLRGEAVVMNNSALTNTAILNFADMARRRMIYSIGVTYDTTAEQMQEIPSLIKRIIDHVEHTEFNRCHFTEFADSSLNFELVYYIDTRDYTVALNAQQNINLSIMKSFAERGIEFAVPRQTVYLEGSTTAGLS